MSHYWGGQWTRGVHYTILSLLRMFEFFSNKRLKREKRYIFPQWNIIGFNGDLLKHIRDKIILFWISTQKIFYSNARNCIHLISFACYIYHICIPAFQIKLSTRISLYIASIMTHTSTAAAMSWTTSFPSWNRLTLAPKSVVIPLNCKDQRHARNPFCLMLVPPKMEIL